MGYEVVTGVKCPFCGFEIVPFDTCESKGIPLYACCNPHCEESEDLVGTIEMWCNLVIVSDEMKYYGRQLDVAVGSLHHLRDVVKEGLEDLKKMERK